MIKSRFCPSPTGYVHMGNMRTALFNALLAYKKLDGIFLVRIEDTDTARSEERYTNALLQDLRWLGLIWHEGPKCDGPHAPYWQSQRTEIYEKYYNELIAKGFAYPCFCTEAQLELSRKLQRAANKPPRYAGTCRNLTPEMIKEKLAQGLKPSLRFNLTAGEKRISFIDLVKGEQSFSAEDTGDFVIRKSDGSASFMFSNAIDDSLMGVTHALRGEDHLTNTPRQLWILKALNMRTPQYGHISLIVGPDNSPLSKRHGAKSIHELAEEGYLPIALLNYLARLGHYYESNDLMSLKELAEKFSLQSLGSAPAKFDLEQMRHWQKLAVLSMPPEEVWKWIKDKIGALAPSKQALTKLFRAFVTSNEQLAFVELDGVLISPKEQLAFAELVRENILFPHEAELWARAFFAEKLIFNEEQLSSLKQVSSDFYQIALEAVNQHGTNFSEIANHVKKATGAKGKALFMPLRLALTGQEHGPELAKICALIGKGRIIKRFKYAMEKCQPESGEKGHVAHF